MAAEVDRPHRLFTVDEYHRMADADIFGPEERVELQVWATFQVDYAGLRLLDVIGDDRVLWGSDYPHADST